MVNSHSGKNPSFWNHVSSDKSISWEIHKSVHVRTKRPTPAVNGIIPQPFFFMLLASSSNLSLVGWGAQYSTQTYNQVVLRHTCNWKSLFFLGGKKHIRRQSPVRTGAHKEVHTFLAHCFYPENQPSWCGGLQNIVKLLLWGQILSSQKIF